jgi:hypothetical protein
MAAAHAIPLQRMIHDDTAWACDSYDLTGNQDQEFSFFKKKPRDLL